MEVENCLLVWVIYSTIIVVTNQEPLELNSITVYPQVYEERQGGSGKLLFIHHGYSLQLMKASVLADTVSLRDVTESGIVEKYVNGKYYERNLYHDTAKQASLLIKPQAGGLYQVVGILNATHEIRPLEITQRSSEGHSAHKISRILIEKYHHDVVATARSAGLKRGSTPLETKPRRQLPDNFTMELSFLSDFTHSQLYRHKEQEHIEYVTVLMLAVSLRLQMLTPPGFISLTKIMRTLTKVRETFLKMRDDERLSVEGTLDKLSEYAKTDNRMKTADAVFMATERPMVHIDSSGNEAGNAIGMAPRGGICTKDKVAIGKDKPGTYSGISTIVHELGHLLNLPHDGDKGAEACLGSHGYIMSPVHGGKRNNEWSQCSKNMAKEFLRSRESRCLNENKNKDLSPLNLALRPGIVISGKVYCKKFFPNYNATFDESFPTDNCSFRCKLETSDVKTEEAIIFAPEGTPCQHKRPEKKCRYGFCM